MYKILSSIVFIFFQCESMHSRDLRLQDSFAKGCTLSVLSDQGVLLEREYGRDTNWLVWKSGYTLTRKRKRD